METFTLTREQSRALDRRAITELGIPGLVLMENAGRGCVDVLERLGIDGPVVILCGKGNNAGDGFVIARHLEIRGHVCRVLLLSPPAELKGDAAANYGDSAKVWRADRAWLHRESNWKSRGRAPLGLSMHCSAPAPKVSPGRRSIGPLIGSTDAQGNRKILAVDVPSGLDCDTGLPAHHTVRAHHTCTFAAMKIGYLQDSARPFTGTVHVCDIGVPVVGQTFLSARTTPNQ